MFVAYSPAILCQANEAFFDLEAYGHIPTPNETKAAVSVLQ